MVILGVDPGMEGGLALRYADDSIYLLPMPIDRGFIDLDIVCSFLSEFGAEINGAFMEMQSLRPFQQGQFKIGRNFGHLEACFWACKVPLEIIQPLEWSRTYDHGVQEKNKQKRYHAIKKARAEIAARIYPGISFLATEKSTVPHSGLVDAALICDYGWNLKQKERQ